MDIITTDRLKIVATLVVRDEEDILEAMLAHTVKEGVSQIFVTDNASKDGTRRILERFPEVISITESDDMTHNQEVHTTRMAREACKLKPDWIVHLDADEFWCNLEALGRYTGPEVAVWCPCAYVHPPVPGIVGNYAPLERMRRYIDFQSYAREFKVVHRPDPNIQVKHGNHGVVGHRMGICHEIPRHHYPIRSYSQFHRKVKQGALALKSRNFVCERWYLWLEELEFNNLETIYRMMSEGWESFSTGDVPPEDQLRRLLLDGYKVMPETVRDIFLALRSAGLAATIGEWVPSTFKRKRLF